MLLHLNMICDDFNVFVRYVPLLDLYKDGYDVMHSYATGYPINVFQQMGFTVCSGHQWLRASNATLRFLDIVLRVCRSSEKCDDQVAYNTALAGPARITWDDGLEPNRPDAPRFGQQWLLMEQLTGLCQATNHSVKIWSRDFAFRSHVEPATCPSIDNWVAMPVTGSLNTTGMPEIQEYTKAANKNAKVATKMATMDKYLQLCGPKGSLPKRAVNATEW